MELREQRYWEAAFEHLFTRRCNTTALFEFERGRLVSVAPHDFHTGPDAYRFKQMPQGTFYRWWTRVLAGWGSPSDVLQSNTWISVGVDARHEEVSADFKDATFELFQLWVAAVERWLTRTRNSSYFLRSHKMQFQVSHDPQPSYQFYAHLANAMHRIRESNGSEGVEHEQVTATSTMHITKITVYIDAERTIPRAPIEDTMMRLFVQRAECAGQLTPSLEGHHAAIVSRTFSISSSLESFKLRYFPVFVFRLNEPWIPDELKRIFPPHIPEFAASLWHCEMRFNTEAVQRVVRRKIKRFEEMWLTTLSDYGGIGIAAITIHGLWVADPSNATFLDADAHRATTWFLGDWTIFHDMYHILLDRRRSDLHRRLAYLDNFYCWEHLVELIEENLE